MKTTVKNGLYVLLALGIVYTSCKKVDPFGNKSALNLEISKQGAAVALKQISLPITFDDGSVDYTVSDFGNNMSVVAADPANPANHVLKTIKNKGAQVWAGTTLSTTKGLATAIPASSTAPKITVMIYSPAAGLDIKLKLENHTSTNNVSPVETDVKTTKSGQWETLTFDFSKNAAGTPAFKSGNIYDLVSIFFDFGNAGAGTVFYTDNVQLVGAPTPVVTLKQINVPVTFDDATVDYSVTDFGNNASVVTVDPANGANHVLKTVKTKGAQTWAGTTISTVKGFASAIPVTATASKMTVMIYSPAAGLDIKLKLDNHANSNAGLSVETDVKTTKSGQWEMLTFDFSKNASGTPAFKTGNVYDLASIFFDFGNAGTGAVFYTDNLQMAAAAPVALKQITVPVTFDDATVDYSVTDFGNNASVVTVDPMNASNHVLKTTKTKGAQTWAGTTISTVKGFATAIPVTASATKMTVMVYSPAAGLDIKLKLDNHANSNAGLSVETDVKTTKTGQWEMLTFDFSKNASGTPSLKAGNTYDLASIFFDFGNAGTGSVFYTDNLQMAAVAPPVALKQITVPVTFEDPTVDYTMTDFGNNMSVVSVDPTNGSNHVLKTIKTKGAEVWAGTTLSTVKGFATAISSGSSVPKMSIMIYSPAAGLDIKLKIDNHANSNAGQSVETDVMTTKSGQWETLTFDFAKNSSGTPAFKAGNVYDLASIFFDFGKTGSGSVFYTDNLQTLASSTPVVSLKQISLPVSFEDPKVDYTMTDFGSNMSVLSADPIVAGNHVMQTKKMAGAQTWAGTTIGTDAGFSSLIGFTSSRTKMTVRVYSPAAGLHIRLKVEDHNDGTRSVETEAVTTKAKQWETLTFNFSQAASGTATLNFDYRYDKASIFFDFGNPGSGSVYFWDDVTFL